MKLNSLGSNRDAPSHFLKAKFELIVHYTRGSNGDVVSSFDANELDFMVNFGHFLRFWLF